MIRFVLGGQCSGKTKAGLDFLMQDPGPHLLLATGRAGDFGFRQQILDHKMERPPDIAVIEPEMDLGQCLFDNAGKWGGILVDSLDFWLFTCQDSSVHGAATSPFTSFDACLARWNTIARAHLTIISSETGLGLISANASSRRFVRELGKLNQHTAAHSDEVYFVAAGLRLPLKRT